MLEMADHAQTLETRFNPPPPGQISTVALAFCKVDDFSTSCKHRLLLQSETRLLHCPFTPPPCSRISSLQALAILRGEPPTRKRARQYDSGELPRPMLTPPFQDPSTPSRPPGYFGGPPTPVASPTPQPPLARTTPRPPGGFQGSYPPAEPGGRVSGFFDEGLWPRQGPFVMPLWRDAIQK